MEEERQILSVAPDIIHCSQKGRVKIPTHLSLAMCVHQLTSFKCLIELLNGNLHCVFYDEMCAYEYHRGIQLWLQPLGM